MPTATGDAILLLTEGQEPETIGRARAWGLSLDRIHLPGARACEGLRLDDASAAEIIGLIAQEKGAPVVFIDALRGAHRLDENSSEMFALMARLQAVACDCGIAVVVCHRLRKKGQFEPAEVTLDRVRGSSAITQVPRVVIGASRPVAGLDTVRLEEVKDNLAARPEPFGMTITDTGPIFGAAPETPAPVTARHSAEGFLLKALKHGERRAGELMDEAEALGINKRTLQWAMATLGLVAERHGPKGVFWGLPAAADRELAGVR